MMYADVVSHSVKSDETKNLLISSTNPEDIKDSGQTLQLVKCVSHAIGVKFKSVKKGRNKKVVL